VSDFQQYVRPLCIYIQEAHAVDTWPLGLPVENHSTHTLEQRRQVTKEFIERTNFKHPTLIDVPPSEAFDQLFCAWPLRFYVLDLIDDKGRVSFIEEPESDIVLIDDLRRFLNARFDTNFQV